MRVLVVGGGVVGITTAYELGRRGHEVEVLEREPDVATGASAVNAGLLVPGDALVWGTPEVPRLLAGTLLGHGGFLRVRASAGPSLVPWGVRFLRESTTARMRANIEAVHALSAFGYAELRAIQRREVGLDAAGRSGGMVFLYGSMAALEAGRLAREPLAQLGERYEVLTPEGLVALDPGYARAAEHVAGALHAPSGGSADCGVFTRALARRAETLGVTITLGTPVAALTRDATGRVTGARTATGDVRVADVTVLAAGAWSAQLARGAGRRVPIVPVKGYALTLPVQDPAAVPVVGGVDEDAHVAFSPMDGALRMSSTAEFAGLHTGHRPSDFDAIRAAAERLFGDALDVTRARPASGLRPSTPSGRPLIGPLGDGLLINGGHGHLGWTEAAGAAALLADGLEGRRSAIDPTPFLP